MTLEAEVNRRTLLKGAAWAAPAVALAVAAPAAAASVEMPAGASIFISGYSWLGQSGWILWHIKDGLPYTVTEDNLSISDPRVSVESLTMPTAEWFVTFTSDEVVDAFTVTITVPGIAPTVVQLPPPLP
jgi:hypothetical protein